MHVYMCEESRVILYAVVCKKFQASLSNERLLSYVSSSILLLAIGSYHKLISILPFVPLMVILIELWKCRRLNSNSGWHFSSEGTCVYITRVIIYDLFTFLFSRQH